MAKENYTGIGDAGQQPKGKSGEFCGVGSYSGDIPKSQQEANHGAVSPQSGYEEAKSQPPSKDFGGCKIFKKGGE